LIQCNQCGIARIRDIPVSTEEINYHLVQWLKPDIVKTAAMEADILQSNDISNTIHYMAYRCSEIPKKK
jgi:hypothetical protein